MNKELFKEIINEIEELNLYYDEYYRFGLDLFRGNCPVAELHSKLISLFLRSIYTEEGLDWIEWFMYENDYGKSELEAFDEEVLICQDIDSLYEYVKQYELC